MVASQFARSRIHADFVLCANVLSAIPGRDNRLRAIGAIRSHLKAGAVALFVVQFRNSHFKRWHSATNAISHDGGWLVRGRTGASFYALLQPDELAEHVLAGGLYPVDVWTKGEAAVVLALRT